MDTLLIGIGPHIPTQVVAESRLFSSLLFSSLLFSSLLLVISLLAIVFRS
jgi:hypothetical protein